MTSLPDEIERVALLGWRLYPASAWPGSKAACFKGATDAATADLDQLEAWSLRYPDCNWRVVMQGSGIWALDVDAPGPGHEADGLAEMATLVQRHGALPTGPRTRSGGGGVVLFFTWSGERIRGKSGHPAPGLDPRPGDGRQSVTLPPSIHHTTRHRYRWVVPPWEVNPPAAPDWLLRAVAPPPEVARPRAPMLSHDNAAHRRLSRAREAVLSACSGSGNSTLNKEAFSVARHVAAGTLGEAEAVDVLYAAARHRRIPDREARDTIRSAFRAGYAKPHDVRPAR